MRIRKGMRVRELSKRVGVPPRRGRVLAVQGGSVEVRWLRGLMDRYDCIEYARHVAHGLAGAAAHEFSLVYADLPASRDRDFIEGLTTWVFERS